MSPRKDKIINSVIEKILKRSEAGYKKYGVGLDKDKQTLDAWLNHLQEELMDAVNYIEKARAVLTNEVEECMLKRCEEFNDNISKIDINEEEIL